MQIMAAWQFGGCVPWYLDRRKFAIDRFESYLRPRLKPLAPSPLSCDLGKAKHIQKRCPNVGFPRNF